jgi:hypothetical protein
MKDHRRLQSLSGILYWVALVLSVVLPLLVLVYAGKWVTDPASLLPLASGLPSETTVTSAQAGLVAAVALASVLPMVAALRGMVRLFGRYREADVLSVENAETILQIGRAMVVVALFTVITPTLRTLILSWNGPQKTLAIGLDSGTLGFLMAAGMLTVIGWAMREAAAVKAENAGFV